MRSKHRAWIGVRVEALLDPYWQTRPSEPVKEMILADWMAALENYDAEEITAACREYSNGPDCSVKPKPGHITKIMNAGRARIIAALPKPVEEAITEISPDELERRRLLVAEIIRGVSKGAYP